MINDRPTITMTNWREPDMVRHAFQRIEEFQPTALISRGAGPVADLPTALDAFDLGDLGDLRVSAELGTVREVLDATETDSWLVLHRGRLLVEEYAAPMTAATRHLLMSVSKSIVGAVVGALVDRGVLDPSRPVADVVPELAGSGYDGARLRDVLDMRSGVRFNEDYLDPEAEVCLLDESVGWAPRSHGGPATLKDFLRRTVADRPHGGPFHYRSCETDVLGWICEAATGRPFAELASELLWSRLGAEADAAICVDGEGTGVFDGGICATARDLARFGLMLLHSGVSATGERVLSSTWIDDIVAGEDDITAAFAAAPEASMLPGGSYRSQCWVPAGRETVMCVGIHGQFVYVDRAASAVIVKLSSWPMPWEGSRMAAALQLFAAVGDRLRRA
ncbi:serine hydrolase domain-containing protein [Nocardioides sp. Iso805N]|uniref:serine hydrolase domain-containing protein n=1 Tax=Nocardioides sp. Iso805N TaxID=1283287 RepID=UPI00036B8DC9|nr:serine hydrolase [Nocardioides sp. Iso805N]